MNDWSGSWVVIITALFLGVAQTLNLIFGYFRERAQIIREEAKRIRDEEFTRQVFAREEAKRLRDEEVARQVAEVKRVAEETSKSSSNKLDTIHTLVNNNMEIQLEISAVALRRVASLEKTGESIKAADLAESLLKDHKMKQERVDMKENKDG